MPSFRELTTIPLSPKVQALHGPEKGVFHGQNHRQLSASERLEQVAYIILEEEKITARRLTGERIPLKSAMTCVLGPNQILYLSPGTNHEEDLCHGSCTWGREVYFAGELRENEKGELIFTNKSGHYRPREDSSAIKATLDTTHQNVDSYFSSLHLIVKKPLEILAKGIQQWTIVSS